MNRDIRLRVEGALLERLVQKALSAGAVFASVHRTGPRSMEIQTDRRSAEILMKLCRRYGLNCRIVHSGGLTAFSQTLYMRRTLLAGLVLCAIMCTCILSRIWLVEVAFTGSCAHLGNADAIHAVLQDAGIHPGMRARNIDSDLLQKQISASAGDYSFIGVRRNGIHLLVEASPEVPAPSLYAIEQARDLVAARDGVVQSVQVYSGEACVQPGDTVLKGQMLIRGEEMRTQEETASVSALGSVTARCWFEGNAECETLRIIDRPTGERRTSCALKLMQFRIPIAPCESFAQEETQTQLLPVVGLFLPLEFERITHIKTVTEGMQADEDALQEQLKQIALADARRQLPDAPHEIAAQWTDVQRNEHSLRIRAVYEIYTDIAAERDALTEEVY